MDNDKRRSLKKRTKPRKQLRTGTSYFIKFIILNLQIIIIK